MWCPPAVKEAYLTLGVLAIRPPGIDECEQQAHDNAPGDPVWIPRLTPHWVEAGSLSATLTFAFREFKYHPPAGVTR